MTDDDHAPGLALEAVTLAQPLAGGGERAVLDDLLDDGGAP